MVYRVVQSTRGSMMSSKPSGFDATVRHLFRMLDGTPKFWATLQGAFTHLACRLNNLCADASAGLAPVSKSIMRFYYFSAQLSINELHMLSLVSPSLETAQVALLQCKDSAVLVLQHVIEDMAPSGFIPYTQDGIAFATAYAGVWLYKVRLAILTYHNSCALASGEVRTRYDSRDFESVSCGRGSV